MDNPMIRLTFAAAFSLVASTVTLPAIASTVIEGKGYCAMVSPDGPTQVSTEGQCVIVTGTHGAGCDGSQGTIAGYVVTFPNGMESRITMHCDGAVSWNGVATSIKSGCMKGEPMIFLDAGDGATLWFMDPAAAEDAPLSEGCEED